jgi:hypothetical protein
MLAMSEAASQLPGERHIRLVLSAESFFHFCGAVHEISCCSQTTDCPPAMADNCSAVGLGGSASAEAAPVRPFKVGPLVAATCCCALRLK